jgi:hypothetical protein
MTHINQRFSYCSEHLTATMNNNGLMYNNNNNNIYQMSNEEIFFFNVYRNSSIENKNFYGLNDTAIDAARLNIIFEMHRVYGESISTFLSLKGYLSIPTFANQSNSLGTAVKNITSSSPLKSNSVNSNKKNSFFINQESTEFDINNKTENKNIENNEILIKQENYRIARKKSLECLLLTNPEFFFVTECLITSTSTLISFKDSNTCKRAISIAEVIFEISLVHIVVDNMRLCISVANFFFTAALTVLFHQVNYNYFYFFVYLFIILFCY